MKPNLTRRWRQLRWRIVGSQMLVVLVGVVSLLLVAPLTLSRLDPARLTPPLVALAQAPNTAAAEPALAALRATLQSALLSALAVAALAALLAGLLTSLPLARRISRSLRQLTLSSRRIANGHYDERVPLPDTEELAQLAADFNRMAAALAQIEQQRVALIGNVSHELRTPLSGIEGYLEGLMDGLFPSETETFAAMYQEVRRLRRLVDDLQALSRVEAGQVPLHPAPFDLVPVVHRVLRHLRPQAQALDLRTELPPALWVQADPDRTAQILVNLLGNAIQYTPSGGTVTVRAEAAPPVVRLAVRDTGPGIPAEALPYLFERFYRVDPSRARRSGGSGIGLTIARHLAWAMQGELTAHSPGPGRGSTFTLSLPLPHDPSQRARPESSPS